jgi:hypothetical protein
MSKNIVQWGRSRKTIWLTRIACWIPKATHSLKYVILIAFPLQQLLHERASMLCYMQVASLAPYSVCKYVSHNLPVSCFIFMPFLFHFLAHIQLSVIGGVPCKSDKKDGVHRHSDFAASLFRSVITWHHSLYT